MQDKYTVLKKYFGYSTFRDGQEPLIDALLQGRDGVGIMPTGAGKSLCFQVPALLFEGITLVVSPLISLMKDQVNALNEAGVPAAFINSSLSSPEYFATLEAARDGAYRLIYVAPERLLSDGFISFAQNENIAMVSIDEAHCVSQWGQDFRPSYLKIKEFIDLLKNRPIVSAFTATATDVVREDMIKILELENPKVVATGFDRKNLYFEVRKPKSKIKALLNYLDKNKDKSGIVYCATRKSVEEVCLSLEKEGYLSTRYHAGLSDNERRTNQDDFLYDRKTVMVATNAFGMGIDKSNVAFVVHFNMPKNIESYYQEAGRSGRDGTAAECILLYGGQDVITNQFFIENSVGREDLDQELYELVRAKDRERLKVMTYYCHTKDCLRSYILKYFGEDAQSYCGNCSNCNETFEEMDITVEAQKIMSCIKRVREAYGIKMIIDVLRGSENERIVRSGLNRLSTHGIMKDKKEKEIREMINYLVLHEYLCTTNDTYPIIKLTEKAKCVLFGEEKLKMKTDSNLSQSQDEEDAKYEEKGKFGKSKRQSKKSAGDLSPEKEQLLENLKKVRSEIAAKKGVPAFVIFADAALMDMCHKMPQTEEDFLEVSGVGKVKLQQYGAKFLKAIDDFS